jgi:hypothetical protein
MRFSRRQPKPLSATFRLYAYPDPTHTAEPCFVIRHACPHQLCVLHRAAPHDPAMLSQPSMGLRAFQRNLFICELFPPHLGLLQLSAWPQYSCSSSIATAQGHCTRSSGAAVHLEEPPGLRLASMADVKRILPFSYSICDYRHRSFEVRSVSATVAAVQCPFPLPPTLLSLSPRPARVVAWWSSMYHNRTKAVRPSLRWRECLRFVLARALIGSTSLRAFQSHGMARCMMGDKCKFLPHDRPPSHTWS